MFGVSVASLLGSAADVLISFQSGVVTEVQLSAVVNGLVVVEDGGAGLPLEVDTVLVLVGHFGDLNSDLGMLEDGVGFLLLSFFWHINLALSVESHLPVSVRYFVGLVLLTQLSYELGQQVVGFEV